VWRFYTVPGDPAKGPDGAASDAILAKAAETWNGQWWKLGGGGTVWDAIVYDDDFNAMPQLRIPRRHPPSRATPLNSTLS
jgi:quinohemoprotein ethanol dehydrogenase